VRLAGTSSAREDWSAAEMPRGATPPAAKARPVPPPCGIVHREHAGYRRGSTWQPTTKSVRAFPIHGAEPRPRGVILCARATHFRGLYREDPPSDAAPATGHRAFQSRNRDGEFASNISPQRREGAENKSQDRFNSYSELWRTSERCRAPPCRRWSGPPGHPENRTGRNRSW
jgi:hypothetical protein